MSASVVVYVAVHVSTAPTASVVDGQLTPDRPGRGSLTATDVEGDGPCVRQLIAVVVTVPAAAKLLTSPT